MTSFARSWARSAARSTARFVVPNETFAWASKRSQRSRRGAVVLEQSGFGVEGGV